MEINAGAWYLRGVPADGRYRWEVCESVTGEVVAAVTLDPEAAVVSSDGANADAIAVAEQAVRRFADQALGITIGG